MEWEFNYKPQPKQLLLHTTAATQILFGGAVGGGKSAANRADAVFFCLEVDGIECYLFRRTIKELQDNHIRELIRSIPPEIGRFNAQRSAFEFHNGSRIMFCYCESEADLERYQGAEFHWLGIDEACQFTPYMLSYLRSRLRLGSFQQQLDKIDQERLKEGKPKIGQYLPRMVMTSNPVGGPGALWLKETFIDQAPYYTLFHDEKTSFIRKNGTKYPGHLSIFIKSTMDDNKFIDENYEANLMELPPDIRKALRDGSWDVVIGGAIHNFNREKHVIPNFKVPRHWTRIMSIDWGMAKPFAVLWGAVASETVVLKDKRPDANNKNFVIPAGAIVIYREFYGCQKGRRNEGIRWDAKTVARKIVEMEEEWSTVKEGQIQAYDRAPDERIADYQMWAQTDGPSPRENMIEETNGYLDLRQCNKDRKANYHEVICRLAGSPKLMKDGSYGDHPMLFFMERCSNCLKTIPILKHDKDPEKGVDKNQEDHLYDSLSYLLASRPYAMTKKEYTDLQFEEEFEKHIPHKVPYSHG